MSRLLLNLRNVPDDEADDVRRFLDSGGIGYYETLMAEYQRERQARARAERDEAQRNGTAETFADVLRTQPLRIALTVLAIALLLGVMALPVLLLWK
jgi:hypothetical protein